MLLNATAQHRGKHFDLLLARELLLLEREHIQNVITLKKLERSIRRDNNQIPIPNRKKLSIPFSDIHDEHNDTISYQNMRINRNKYSIEKPRLASISTIVSQNQSDEATPAIFPRYRRYCMKGHRLPPLVKANKSNRQKRSNKDLHWVANSPQANIDQIFPVLNEELPKAPLPELSPMEKQIQSFMKSLPTYKDIQRGFDNFGPSSLYSNRAPVAMR